ncbi:hypothetical protein HN592_03555 [Candidatus Woesearchaeota archaeon]|mgnify:FL=1|jgi:hypothetical protein|nr:hypothetical protein [Candidatus Woesearchaeota archaeon]MBT4368288.1 hypothetical protein [Candidatus Woesearchaeota archaeon]MBT4712777.1 hypothetical protein [Candidatus Woesearchaeota archaeon]MBT6639689.1 hypothetical protein [Candidatus Woesearchaeota archaeon]MBT7133861.1 hypothetical protein [Candidatus Woesearchaeota archaeon]
MFKRGKKKRKLNAAQEFEVFKLVLNKFLWIGFVLMIYGVYKAAIVYDVFAGILWMIGGIVLLLLLVRIIVKGYEIKKVK